MLKFSGFLSVDSTTIGNEYFLADSGITIVDPSGPATIIARQSIPYMLKGCTISEMLVRFDRIGDATIPAGTSFNVNLTHYVGVGPIPAPFLTKNVVGPTSNPDRSNNFGIGEVFVTGDELTCWIQVVANVDPVPIEYLVTVTVVILP